MIRLRFLIALFFTVLLPFGVLAQKSKIQRLGNLEFVGTAKHAGIALPGIVVTALSELGDSAVFTTIANGNFLVIMDLNKSYDIYFRKQGYITRYVHVNAAVPEEDKITDFSYKFNMDLYTAEDKMPLALFSKAAARISYDNNFADFDFDGIYNKRLQEEIKHSKDSLIAIKTDSLYRVKLKGDSLSNAQSDKDKRDRELKAKAMADSLSKADADAKAKKAAEALKLEIEKQARAKADSTARAAALADAKAKAEVERLKALEAANLKAREDSTSKAKVEADRLKALADQREKARQDSIAKDKEAKDKAEQLRALEAAKLKAREDSIAKAKSLKDKIAEDKRLADIAAQKKVVVESEKKKATQELPKVDKEYPEGATQETIKEARRTILRTVVNRQGTQYVLYRVEYDWGGVFFFKNESSISEPSYNQEMVIVKSLKK